MATNLNKIIIAALALIVGFLLLKNFVGALVLAGTLAYVLWPTYNKISEKTSRQIAAYVLTVIIAAIVISIVFFGASVLLNQVAKSYIYVSRTSLDQIEFKNPDTTEAVKNGVRLLFSKVISWLSGALASVPKIIISLFVFITSFFYFLKDGEAIMGWLRKNIPLSEDKKAEVFGDTAKYINAFVTVWILIGALQAIVAGAGFYIFGIPYPLIGAVVAAILSILPIIGPYAMYLPLGGFLYLSGRPDAGIGILIYGLIFGSILDYILRPYLAGQRAEAHPLIILLGLLGGLTLLGAAGVIAGPVLLLAVVTILKSTNLKLSK